MMRGTGELPDWQTARERIAANGARLGTPLTVEACVVSTNDLAKSAAKNGAAHGATWVAEEQTGGRGRQGRTWVSPRGENLLFSVLLRPSCRHERVPLTAVVAGVCVAEALVARGLDARVKWPNDVLVGGRKIAGILVEAVTRGTKLEAIIVGMGVNVHTRDMPPEIAARATSCALAGARDVDRGALLADILARLEREVEHVLARGLGLLHARLTKLDALAGARVMTRREDGQDEAGVARGIDDEGRLIVLRDDGVTTTWVSGEVHLAL